MPPKLASRYWLAVLGLAMLPLSRAGAEPILWSYSTTALPTGPYVYPSYATMKPTGLTYSDQGNMALALTGVNGDVTRSTGQSFSGSQLGYWLNAVNIQPVVQGYNFGEVGHFSATKNTFDLTVRLTDGPPGALYFMGE